MTYVLLFIFMILLRHFVGTRRQANRRAYFLLLSFLFLFSAFRFEVGPDWRAYLNIFQIQSREGYLEALGRSEPGYWLLNKFVHDMNWPYAAVNVLSSFVFFAGLHMFARRQPDPLGFLVLTFPVLIINMPMTAVRQAMGVGMICVALNAFNDKRVLPFVFFVLLGSSFHSSTLVFLLLLPLVTGRFSKNRLFFSGILAIPGAVALSRTSSAELMQSRYVESNIDAAGAIFRISMLLTTGLFFHWGVKRYWQRRFSCDLKLASVGSWMMLALLPLIFLSTVIADRFGYYLVVVQTMVFARLPYLLNNDSNRRLLTVVPYLGLLIMFVVWTHYSWIFQAGYIPYKTWLFGFPRGRF